MIPVFNTLRFLFITLIFLFHIGLFGYGYSGVTFFFMLSGFVLTLGYGEKALGENFSYGNFMKKRISKLYPLHLLCLAFFIVYHLSMGHHVNFSILIPNLFLVQSWVPRMSFYSSGNGVTWFLSDTIFFYAMFPLLCRWMHGHFRRFVTGLGIALVVYFVLIQLIPAKLQHGLFYINPAFRLLDFILGMLLCKAYLVLKNRPLSRLVTGSSFAAAVLIFVGFSFIHAAVQEPYGAGYNVYSFASLYWIPCAFLILTGALYNPGHQGALGRWGTYSFTFFMIHQLILFMVDDLVPQTGAWASLYVRAAVLFPICYTLAYLIFTCFEKPAIRSLQRRIGLRA